MPNNPLRDAVVTLTRDPKHGTVSFTVAYASKDASEDHEKDHKVLAARLGVDTDNSTRVSDGDLPAELLAMPPARILNEPDKNR